MKNNDMKQQLVQMANGAHVLATQILGNPDDAADAVHDAIAKVLRKPDAYNAGSGPLKPWFMRVVRNGCIDLIRRRRPADDTVEVLSDPQPGPESLAENAQRDQLLHIALAKLPSGQREIIVLRDYMDLSYAEIAGVQDMAQGTVMSRLHRARMALKQELTRHD